MNILQSGCSTEYQVACMLIQIFEKYQWGSSILVKLRAYSLQFLWKWNTFKGIFELVYYWYRTLHLSSLPLPLLSPVEYQSSPLLHLQVIPHFLVLYLHLVIIYYLILHQKYYQQLQVILHIMHNTLLKKYKHHLLPYLTWILLAKAATKLFLAGYFFI